MGFPLKYQYQRIASSRDVGRKVVSLWEKELKSLQRRCLANATLSIKSECPKGFQENLHSRTQYQSARDTIIKYCRQGSSNNRNGFPHSSGGQKYEINWLLVEMDSSETSVWLEDGHFLPVSSYDLPSSCVCILTSSSFKDSSPIRVCLFLQSLSHI